MLLFKHNCINNKTMKKITILFSTLFLFLFSNCSDEFMERFPETTIGKENFFNSEEDLKMYTYSFYDFPGTSSEMYYSGGVWDMYSADAYITTDNCANTGNTEVKTMMIGNPSSATIVEGWNWEKLRNINFFLENFGKANISQELLNHYEGLARFFRARFYMNKVKRYSNVPWYDKVIETSDKEALTKPCDTREFVINKIFEDYDFASQYVQENQPTGAVDKWTVLAYKARHALYEGTYRKYHSELNLQSSANTYLEIARDAAKEIMDNGGFSIYTTGDIYHDYESLFNNTDLTSNPEIILTDVNETDVKNSGWWAFAFGEYEICPSKSLLQDYLMNDGSFYTDQPGYQTKLFVEEFQNRDPRLYQSYAYPGWVLVYTETYATGAGVYIQKLNKNFTGYHQIKGFVNTTDYNVYQSLDLPVVRYAEVLLTYAEARAELGELTQADLDMTINVLRDRAGMPHLTMNPPVEAIQEARYPLVASSTTQWKELLEIRRERRIELAFEGFRYDDLMRWYACKLLEEEPVGIYFPGLGKYDLTGDGIEDIKLIDVSETIPLPEDKDTNSLGVKLIYYRAGLPDSDAGVYLENGTYGNCVSIKDMGTFIEPKYYYRPIPETQVTLNPNLTQIFGWN
jgi:hypothetical protein